MVPKLGNFKRRLVEFVPQVLLGTELEQDGYRLRLAHHGRPMKRRVSKVSDGIDSCPAGYKGPNIIRGPYFSGDVKHRVIHGTRLIYVKHMYAKELRVRPVFLYHGG